MDVVILGRLIGTADAIDTPEDELEIYAVGFEPVANLEVPSGDITIDLRSGTFAWMDGDDFIEVDLIEKILAVSKVTLEDLDN